MEAVTDATGAIVQEQSFDAWGRRRDATDWSAYSAAELTGFNHSLTTRGFTGHEMLDETGIVHMNGRIYDPTLGRFLQGDPTVQDPLKSASLNRYSYAWNNPLNATDPSGFSTWTDFRDKILKPVAAIALAVAMPGYLAEIGGIFAAADGSATLFAFATAGFVSGGVATGTLKGAAIGAFSGFAFGAIGMHLNGVDAVLAHGLAGGVIAELQGGKFGHGFAAAVITKAVSKPVSKIGTPEVQVVVAAVVGGTVSAITGGKFANGAMSSGFGYAFNQLHATKSRERQEAIAAARNNSVEKLNQYSRVKGWDDDPVGAFVHKHLFGGYRVGPSVLDYGRGTELTWGSGAGLGITDWVVVLASDTLSVDEINQYARVATDEGFDSIYISTTEATQIRDVDYLGQERWYWKFSVSTNYHIRIESSAPICAVVSGDAKCPN